MPYTLDSPIEPCTVCGSDANIFGRKIFNVGEVVDCARCGDFEIDAQTAKAFKLPYKTGKELALASYIIRKMQAPHTRPKLTPEFFEALGRRTLPSPAEAIDNMVVWLGEQADGSPGTYIDIDLASPMLFATAGVVGWPGTQWIVDSLYAQGLMTSSALVDGGHTRAHQGHLTARGWQRFEELKHAHTSSTYAFFARKFRNDNLDKVFEECLRPAVEQTGYELRVATQRAGLVDAVIEDEIRRCRFLIADLSDDNAGAYWEAGFAEGLGKPVIYVCCAEQDGKPMTTHFDANHRHTVRWNLASLDQTATQLKAVIRNTLLGDAKLTD